MDTIAPQVDQTLGTWLGYLTMFIEIFIRILAIILLWYLIKKLKPHT